MGVEGVEKEGVFSFPCSADLPSLCFYLNMKQGLDEKEDSPSFYRSRLYFPFL